MVIYIILVSSCLFGCMIWPCSLVIYIVSGCRWTPLAYTRQEISYYLTYDSMAYTYLKIIEINGEPVVSIIPYRYTPLFVFTVLSAILFSAMLCIHMM